MEKKKLIGHIALFSANIIFGLSIPISKSLMHESLSPYALTFFRMAGGMLLFWIASFFVNKETVPAKDILMLFFASIFALILNQMPYIVGLSMTSPIDASIVVTLLPILTMLLAAVFIKEPITFKKTFGVLVGASGALLLVLSSAALHRGESNFWGNMVVFMAATSFALYLTLFKNLVSRYSPITIMKWMFLFATILCYPFCSGALKQTHFETFDTSTLLRIGYVVVLGTFISYILVAIGQKTLRPTTLSMYNYVQPIVASMVAVAMGMDHFGLEKVLSGILVFAGVYIVTQSKSRADLEKQAIGEQ